MNNTFLLLKGYISNFLGGLTTLPELVVTFPLMMVEDFAIPTMGYVTGLCISCLGVGALGLF